MSYHDTPLRAAESRIRCTPTTDRWPRRSQVIRGGTQERLNGYQEANGIKERHRQVMEQAMADT